MAEASRDNTVPVPTGRVGRVCQEWLVREDGVVAYQLQNEEISRHYDGNRSKHHLNRSDFHQAKHLQEDEYNEMIHRFETELKEQVAEDERLAQQLQEEESRRQLDDQIDSVELDRLLALKIQAKEKQKQLRRRIAKEKREVERAKQLNTQVDVDIENNLRLSEPLHADASADVDLSEFCMKPPPGLTVDELRHFLAEQDAELARFLQQQEVKKDLLKDKLAVIESQDHEIARILQEQEKAKARQRKERARAKSTNRNCPSVQSNTLSQGHSEEYEIVTNEMQNGELGESLPKYHNIAMDLDPTYNRIRTNVPDNGLHFAQLCRVSPVMVDEEVSPHSTLSYEADPELDAAAYLPVQGHRRTQEKKKKKSKDGCKTQ
ncbi:hypothetical protein HDE_00013 [Halotydeus destructor]|nr:hypothetical protein HDE_00013 [Halotydeus destructor]